MQPTGSRLSRGLYRGVAFPVLFDQKLFLQLGPNSILLACCSCCVFDRFVLVSADVTQCLFAESEFTGCVYNIVRVDDGARGISSTVVLLLWPRICENATRSAITDPTKQTCRQEFKAALYVSSLVVCLLLLGLFFCFLFCFVCCLLFCCCFVARFC